MAYEQRDNSGALFKNEGDKKRERGPDYSGSCMVDGKDYFFDAWIKTAETGRKWMSFSFKAKEKPQQRQAPAAKPQKSLAQMDDDCPF